MINNVSFTHNIRPVSSADFHRITAGFGKNNFVDYPWTLAESVSGENVFTTRICDCTAGVVTDGEKALMLHLCPSIKENLRFNNLFDFIIRHIDKMAKDSLQAVILGSRNTVVSKNLWNNMSKILETLKIPVSKFRNGKWDTSLAYKRSTDEVLISSYPLDLQIKKGNKSNLELLNSYFEDVLISDCDEIIS